MLNNVFGRNLQVLRVQSGLSQRKLGENLGVCNQTVSFWETGQREPNLDDLVKIASYFSVSTDYLLGLEKY